MFTSGAHFCPQSAISTKLSPFVQKKCVEVLGMEVRKLHWAFPRRCRDTEHRRTRSSMRCSTMSALTNRLLPSSKSWNRFALCVSWQIHTAHMPTQVLADEAVDFVVKCAPLTRNPYPGP